MARRLGASPHIIQTRTQRLRAIAEQRKQEISRGREISTQQKQFETAKQQLAGATPSRYLEKYQELPEQTKQRFIAPIEYQKQYREARQVQVKADPYAQQRQDYAVAKKYISRGKTPIGESQQVKKYWREMKQSREPDISYAFIETPTGRVSMAPEIAIERGYVPYIPFEDKKQEFVSATEFGKITAEKKPPIEFETKLPTKLQEGIERLHPKEAPLFVSGREIGQEAGIYRIPKEEIKPEKKYQEYIDIAKSYQGIISEKIPVVKEFKIETEKVAKKYRSDVLTPEGKLPYKIEETFDITAQPFLITGEKTYTGIKKVSKLVGYDIEKSVLGKIKVYPTGDETTRLFGKEFERRAGTETISSVLKFGAFTPFFKTGGELGADIQKQIESTKVIFRGTQQKLLDKDLYKTKVKFKTSTGEIGEAGGITTIKQLGEGKQFSATIAGGKYYRQFGWDIFGRKFVPLKTGQFGGIQIGATKPATLYTDLGKGIFSKLKGFETRTIGAVAKSEKKTLIRTTLDIGRGARTKFVPKVDIKSFVGKGFGYTDDDITRLVGATLTRDKKISLSAGIIKDIVTKPTKTTGAISKDLFRTISNLGKSNKVLLKTSEQFMKDIITTGVQPTTTGIGLGIGAIAGIGTAQIKTIFKPTKPVSIITKELPRMVGGLGAESVFAGKGRYETLEQMGVSMMPKVDTRLITKPMILQAQQEKQLQKQLSKQLSLQRQQAIQTTQQSQRLQQKQKLLQKQQLLQRQQQLQGQQQRLKQQTKLMTTLGIPIISPYITPPIIPFDLPEFEDKIFRRRKKFGIGKEYAYAPTFTEKIVSFKPLDITMAEARKLVKKELTPFQLIKAVRIIKKIKKRSKKKKK